ncbi:MAG TPA: arylsulfatase A [Bacteroides sp.]|nr:arylsulfatase A [Bacteroides sp.]
MKYSIIPAFITLLMISVACQTEKTEQQPNVILIMADDMGYECISSYEGASYSTPVLDSLAANGIRFDQCVSQPLCTPSRVKIMTGLYNYRNYEYFGYLNPNQYTFGNLMQDAGYETLIAGKWQLNGLAYKDSLPEWSDSLSPGGFGFDEYCLWQLTRARKEGERFADPLIQQNGVTLERDADIYGPDVFCDYILDFISRNKDKPFFVYYPMVLVHDPFVPTPDSEEWEDPGNRYKKDTAFFKDMVAYTDKIVGRIVGKLKELKIDKNTIVIFTGDNGTHPSIYTPIPNGSIRGGKGNTIDAGTHVPLIISWPAKIRKGFVYDQLISFSDFFPTLADIVDREAETDGQSFYSLLKGEEYNSRETVFVHYDPRWSNNVNRFRNQFVRTADYKLYRDGNYYNISRDILEKTPLNPDSLTPEENTIQEELNTEMQNHPVLQED